LFQIPLVPYTNARKSSSFNVLPNDDTYQKNIFFPTLHPKTPQIQLNQPFNLIISHTVPFIHKLPTTFLPPFKSTLEQPKPPHVLIHL
ncbi:P-loop NTPase family protein, partial [Staphylococcus epidermidis]